MNPAQQYRVPMDLFSGAVGMGSGSGRRPQPDIAIPVRLSQL